MHAFGLQDHQGLEKLDLSLKLYVVIKKRLILLYFLIVMIGIRGTSSIWSIISNQRR